MVFKFFCTLLFLVIVSAVIAEESIGPHVASKTDTDESKSENNKRKNEIYLEEGLEVICGNGPLKVHVAAEPKPGWFCQSGYARNTDGKCIKLDQCDKPTCQEHEVFLECNHKDATICQRTCNLVPCNETVCQSGCFCKTGYARLNAVSGTDRIAKCIPKKCCPPNIGDINLEICSKHCQKYFYGVSGILCPE